MGDRNSGEGFEGPAQGLRMAYDGEVPHLPDTFRSKKKPMTEQELLDKFQSIKCFEAKGIRAPHKPLLLLYALARAQRGEPSDLSFVEHEAKLRDLLTEFGRPSGNARPEYPFWRLQNDRLWEVIANTNLKEQQNASGDVALGTLRSTEARGRFLPEIENELRANKTLVNQLASDILTRNFPTSLHQDILDAVGMTWSVETKRRRDPNFRQEILRIYERRCAICGFDGRMGNTNFGIEAAHIQWHAANGPDKPENGLCLCTIHHKALDCGVISLSDDLTIAVSEHITGGDFVRKLIVSFSKQPIATPIFGNAPPSKNFIRWHQQEVFRGPARA